MNLDYRHRIEAIGILTSCLIGAGIAFSVFPAAMLLGFHSYWDSVTGDVATGLVGFYQFAQDRWRWPILFTTNLNSPEGASIFFTDPNGILALVFKIFYKATGILFPYVGPWILICYVLNSYVGYLILRQLGMGLISSAIGCALFVLIPEFIYRFRHHTLMGQFVILLSILSYIRINSKDRTIIEVMTWGLTFGLSFLITPYIYAMSVPIYLAALADGYRNKRVALMHVASSLAVHLVTTLICISAAGLIGSPAGQIDGFSIYSMNLISPIWPQLSYFVPGSEMLAATRGQYEGFNYLGVGILFIVFISAIIGWGIIRENYYHHYALLLIIIMLFIFSLSSDIYIGNMLVLRIPYENIPVISQITGILRVPGRFFWPVAYVLVAAACFIISKRMPPVVAASVLATAVLFQVIDLQPLIQRVTSISMVKPVQEAIGIRDLLSDYTEVRFFPGYPCVKTQLDKPVVLSIQQAAAIEGLPVNGAYLNRGRPNCRLEIHNFMNDPLNGTTTDKPLLVLLNRSLPEGALARAVDLGLSCVQNHEIFVCSKGDL